MKKNGFTLIEMVVVIVILGILAFTAAPRFLAMQTDAKNAALEKLKGAVESGLALGYQKLAIHGLEDENYLYSKEDEIPIEGCGERCIFRHGYPEADYYTLSILVEGINQDHQNVKDWGVIREDDESYTIYITSTKNLSYNDLGEPSLINQNCYLQYTDATLTQDRYQLKLIPCE
ncbi:type II secretion system protein [Vibrio sp. SM6]|uniref:Type II secretion system protein n=1 Tax=Vibrio agarilyticus TaxID=2726741 RepID=A0A7X8YGF3_9VIBR|nr:type II secretion system protein [Vibrio agarilyticus]NLS12356.1 type II secretion system protein [Vibrio agarilyticus]